MDRRSQGVFALVSGGVSADPRITEAQWPLAAAIHLTDFTEVQTGLWLPRKSTPLGTLPASWLQPMESAIGSYGIHQKLAVGIRWWIQLFPVQFRPRNRSA